ncbi:MAG: glycosyltransferase family 2 protein, partial [Ilumatobacteraceae bacterium]
ARENYSHSVDGSARASPPLASVVLPFLDEERFLAEAIETVVAQSLSPWELVLVDDGSTDESAAIADAAAAADPVRVRVLRHPHRRTEGLAASRNVGLRAANAGAIAFLDADDRWDPDKLKIQLRLLADHPDVGMVAGPTTHVSEFDGSRTVQPVTTRAPCVFARGDFAAEIVRERLRMPPPPSAVMYRRGVLREVGGVPRGDSLYEDQRTFVAVNIAQPVLITDDPPLSSYARRPDSLFGSLENDPSTKAEQKRTFEWWVLRYCWRRGLIAWRIALLLGAHRVAHAVRRRRSLPGVHRHR